MNKEKRFRDFVKEKCDIRKWGMFSKIYLFSLAILILIQVLEFLGFYDVETSFILWSIGATWFLLLLLINVIRIEYKYWRERMENV